jgi:hypothetical protein
MNIEQIVRKGYDLAEIKDIPGYVALFTGSSKLAGIGLPSGY